MDQVQKAIRASINLGDIELDVLQFPDGSYHLFINQLNEVLSIKASDSTGKKYVQPLIEANLNQVNKASVEGIKSHLKTLSLDLVSQLVGIYARLGNQKCIAVCIASLAESLERRADAAFGVIRTEETRNNWFNLRMEQSKIFRRSLTDAMRDREEATGEKAPYGFATIRIYRRCGLFDKYQKFKKAGFKDFKSNLTLGELEDLRACEELIAQFMRKKKYGSDGSH
jgi:hypothetical protein